MKFLMFFTLALASFSPTLSRAAEQTPAQIFENRILPIFKSDQPSSCVQCHLVGVDLKNYILPSADRTFLSLRDQGLIDLKSPENSKILRLIQMGKTDKSVPQIHAKNRKLEYEAFSEWIKACVSDEKLRTAPKVDTVDLAKPPRSNEIIRHARIDRVLDSFEKNVWSMRFRCMNCHTEGTPQAEKHAKEHGERVIWIKKEGAEATLKYLLASNLIDEKDPEKSLLLTKPLNTVKHGGGVKFSMGDQGYKGFRLWLDDLAAIKNDTYQVAVDLPKPQKGPLYFGSQMWLKLTDTPEEWSEKLLQIQVFAFDEKSQVFSKDPIATSDRVVSGKLKLWQHTLVVFAEPGSKQAKEWAEKPLLPQGKYLVKVYVDQNEKLKKDWTAKLNDKDYVGQIEIQTDWKTGYNAMTVADAGKVKR